jgi:hypothetical protein
MLFLTATRYTHYQAILPEQNSVTHSFVIIKGFIDGILPNSVLYKRLLVVEVKIMLVNATIVQLLGAQKSLME